MKFDRWSNFTTANVHPSRCGTVVLLFQFHGILLLNLYVVEIRYHPEYRHAAHFLHHPHAVVEQPAVAPEFVDDDALLSVDGLQASAT